MTGTVKTSPDNAAAKELGKHSIHKKPHMLVIDDDAQIRDIMRCSFAGEADITEACDGIEALALLDQCSFDIIICDVQMPRLGGIAVFKKLYSVSPNICNKFLFCTGNATDELHNICSCFNVKSCPKPFEISCLKTVVREMLHREM